MSDPGDGGFYNGDAVTRGLGGDSGGSLLSDATTGPSPYDRALATLGIQQIQAPLLDGTTGTFTVNPAILNWDFSQHNAVANLLNNPPPVIGGSNCGSAPVTANPGAAAQNGNTDSGTFANAVSQMGQSGSPFGVTAAQAVANANAGAPNARQAPNQTYALPGSGNPPPFFNTQSDEVRDPISDGGRGRGCNE